MVDDSEILMETLGTSGKGALEKYPFLDARVNTSNLSCALALNLLWQGP
jgi:hypothetical protein